MEIYKVTLKYRIIPSVRDTFDYVLYVKVQPDEELSDVVTHLKEHLYYEWDNAPLIEGVSYHKIIPKTDEKY